jgi:quercetin dioxygenase-like cupin family protein
LEQVLPAIREGERIAGDGELGVTLLADLDEIGIVDVRAKPSDSTPPLHFHERHAECFLVLDGEIRLRLEDRELQAGPETWVLVPPGVLHTFGVSGDSIAHFLNIHVPSCGFGDFVRGLHAAESEEELRAVRAAFDQQPAPEYASADPGLVIHRRAGGSGDVGSTEPPKSAGAGFAGAGAGTGETITARPERRATILVDADELVVSEFSYGPGERGAKLHVHRHHADGFLVVEGEFTFASRDGSVAGPGGTLLLFPPGVVHGFDNDSSANARCFNLHMPSSGFADYLRGRNPEFDQHDPPADGGADPASAVAVRLPE